jgi:hypothetical protein
MTENEKLVYNKWLATTSQAINKPFRLRENWLNFDCRDDYPLLQRLCHFFSKHTHIKWDDFFLAPYKIRKNINAGRISLEYYTSPKAIKDYTTYMKHLMLLEPDDHQQINLIVESFKYIRDFCLEHKLYAHQYCQYKGGYTSAFLKHIKQHHVSVYAVFAFPESFSTMNGLHPEDYALFLGDINLYTLKTKYEKSQIKPKIQQLYQALQNYLKKNLDSQQ